MKRILALVLSTALLLSGCGAAPEYTEGPGAAYAAPLQLADPAYPAMAQRPGSFGRYGKELQRL